MEGGYTMSDKIDQPIVKMGFDNKEFEKDVATTMNTIDKLINKVNIKEVLATVGRQADAVGKTLSMGNLAQGLMSVSQGFSNFGVIGVTTLTNLTNSAINAGKRIAAALTIDPVRSGFSEYELKMGAVQTIMAGTGETIDKVTDALNQLNEYSDQTVYSFSDMTQNIGKFTNAGVKLPTAVAAIKGISNVAALAGANANEASRAMYNFAQAISSGSVKLLDWKSIELANMGTIAFKQQLIDTAASVGTLTKGTDGLYKTIEGKTLSASMGFNDSLEEQWMTTDVLIKTLEKYSDATTDVGKAASKAATEVKTITQMYSVMKEFVQSGWAQTWESIIGNKEEAVTTLTAISNAFSSILTPSIEARNQMLKYWKTFKGRDAVIEGLGNMFKYLGKLIAPVREAFRTLFPPMTGKTLVTLSFAFLKFTKTMDGTSGVSKVLIDLFSGVSKVLIAGAKAVYTIGRAFMGLLIYMGPAIKLFMEGFAEALDFANALVQTAIDSEILRKALEGLGIGIGAVVYGLSTGIKYVKEFMEELTTSKGANVIVKIGDMFNEGFENIKKAYTFVAPYLDAFIEKFNAIINQLSGEDVKKALAAGGIVAALIIIVKVVKSFVSKIKNSLRLVSSVVEVFDAIRESMEAYQRSLKGNLLIKIAVAIAILVGAVALLSTIDRDALINGVGALSALMGSLVAMMAGFKLLFSKNPLEGAASLAGAILIISFALGALTMSLAKIAGIEGDIWNSIWALGAMMGMLVAMAAVTEKYAGESKGLMKAGLGMNAFATSLLLLVRVVDEISKIPEEDIGRSLGALALIMLMLSAVLVFSKESKLGLGAGLGFIGMAAAIALMAKPLQVLSEMDDKKAGKALIILGVLMTLTGAFLALVGLVGPGAIAAAVAFAILAGSLYILLGAVQLITLMDYDNFWSATLLLEQTFKVLGKGMLHLLVALPGALALMVISVALLALVPAVAALAYMPQEGLDKALKALATFFKILAKSGPGLTAAAPGLILAGVGLGILGLGMLVAGKGMLYFASGLAIIVGLGTAGLVVLAGMFLTISVGIQALGLAVAKGIVDFFKYIGGKMPVILQSLREVLKGYGVVLTEFLPTLVAFFSTFATKSLEALGADSPRFVDAGMTIVMSFLAGIASRQREITLRALQIVVGILDGIEEGQDDVIDASYRVVIGFIDGMTAAIEKYGEQIRTSTKKLMWTFTDQILLSLVEIQDDINAAMYNLLGMGILFVLDNFNGFGLLGKWISAGIKGGMSGEEEPAKAAGAELGNAIYNGAAGALEVNSPSLKFIKLMDWVGQGTVIGLQNQIDRIRKPAGQIGSLMAAEVLIGYTRTMQTLQKKNNGLLDMKRMLLEDTFKIDSVGTKDNKLADYLGKMAADAKALLADSLAGVGDMFGDAFGGGSYSGGSSYASDVTTTVEDVNEKSFRHSQDWIDERKYYNELALADELAAWERVQKRYDKGTEQRKKADKEVYRVKKEINDKLIDINKEYSEKEKDINEQLIRDIRDVNDEYENAIASRAATLYDSYSLFDKVEKRAIVSGSVLTDNLRAQVGEFKDWQAQIASLKAKGLNEDLLSELTAMGPQSIAEIKALNKLTDGQLWIYVELWKDKHAAALAQSEIELAGMKEVTKNTIADMTIVAEEELAKNKVAWDTALKGLTTVVADNFVDATAEAITSIKAMKDPVTAEVVKVTQSIADTFKTVDWTALGKDIIKGLINGMNSMTKDLTYASSSLATTALVAAKKALLSNSPSKKFDELGVDSGQGLINGMRRMSTSVRDEGTYMAESALSMLKATFNNVDRYIAGELNFQPTIAPVLDLTNLQNGSKLINGLFTAPKIAYDYGQAINTSTGYISQETPVGGSVTNNTPVTIEVKNYVRNDSDISKINTNLDKLVTKYNSGKGVRS